MKTETIAIDKVHPLDRNPRRHPERQLAELVKSIEQFGQYRPLVVDEEGTILAGNGLHLALQRAGVEKVSVYRVKGLTEAQKTKLVLSDNKTGDLSNDDFQMIEEMLGELEDFEVPGYDPDTLRELMLTAEEALESSKSYGVISDEDRALLNSRADGVEEERSAALESAGRPPAPFEPSVAQEDEQGPVEVDFSTGTPAGDALAEAVDTRKREGHVCPACGRGW